MADFYFVVKFEKVERGLVRFPFYSAPEDYRESSNL